MWGVEVCVHLVVGVACVVEVRGGGLRYWGLCVFVIKSLRRMWVFSWHFALFHEEAARSKNPHSSTYFESLFEIFICYLSDL